MFDLGALLTPFGAILGAFVGAYFATRFREMRIVRRRHLGRLKHKILEPWLNIVSERFTLNRFLHNIDTPYGRPMSSVNRSLTFEKDPLFEDLNNHFSKLIQRWSDFLQELQEHDDFSLKFAQNLTRFFEKNASLPVREELTQGVILHTLVSLLYHRLLLEAGGNHTSVNENFKIEQSGETFELRVSGSTYASGSREQMQRVKETYFDLAGVGENRDKAKAIVARSKMLSDNVDSIKFELRRFAESNRLDGNCSFLRF